MNTRKLFLTSLLAAATMSVPAFGAGSADTILINFTGGRSNVEPVAVTNDTVNGTWNNEANASQSRPQTLLFSNNTESSATITWSSANTYTTGLSEAYRVLTGYLDDGSGVSISVSDISYLLYDVTIIAATDTPGVKFSYKTVNGVAYTSDGNGGAVFGSSAWGASQQLTVGNNNSFTIFGLTGDLSISSVASGTARGCIAGIQIINTYAGTAHAATLDADSAWTTTQLGSAPWTNSTAEAGKYADVTLSADVNLSASAGIVTDAIVVSGGHTLTLSAAEGNTAEIDLIGPGVVRVADGSTLSLANGTILNFKGSNSSITGAISGAGSLVAKSGSSLNLAGAALTDFTGTVSAESGSTVNFGGGFAGVNFTSGTALGTYNVSFASDSNLKFGLTSAWNSVKLGNSDFSGKVNITAGQFTINESDIGNGTWVLENGVILRQSGTTVAGSTTYDPTTKITTINNDMIVNSGTVEFRVNAGAGGGLSHGSKLIYAGDISGSGTLKRANDGFVDFTGNINLGGFTNASGTTNITGSATLGALNVSGGMLILGGASTSFTSANVSSSGTLKFDIGTDATMNLDHTLTNNGSLFVDSGTLVLSHGDLYGSTTVATGAVLDLTGNTRSADSSGSGNLYISGGIVKIANLGWGAGANFGANFNYDRVQLSNGGVLDVTSAQPNGTGAGERGFSVIAGRGTYRFSGTGSSYSVNGRAEQLISIADGAELVFDVVEASASLTVSKLIARGTDPASGTSVLSTGSVTKKGEGTLMLSHANNYSGGTTIEGGVLVAANASALGAGDVTVADGATLKRGLASGSVAIGGTLTTNGAAILSTGALSVDTAAFAVTGDVTLSTGTIFDLDSIVTNGKLISGTGLSKDGLGIANIYVGGKLVNQRGNATFTVTDNTLVLSAYTAGANYSLTWDGGDAGVWKANGSGWTKDATAESFQHGDSVTFGSDATVKNVSVVGALNTGTITVNDNYAFAFAEEASVSGTLLTVADGSTLTLSGTGTLAVTGHGATGTVELGAGTVYAIDASAEPSDFSLANVNGAVGSTISISASSNSGDYAEHHFTKITGMSSAFLGTLEVAGGFINLGDPSAVNGSGANEVVLSGGIGDSSSSTTGSGLCFMGGGTNLEFSKNIVAKGEGGVLRSYASAENVVEFTGSVTGTTIRHSDGGTHKFSGTVDLQQFVQAGAMSDQTVTEFAGTTTIGTLELALGKVMFSSTNATITTANVAGGTMDVVGTATVDTLNVTGGTTNFTGTATLGTLNNTNGAQENPVGGTVTLGGTATGTTTLAANAGILNIGSTWDLTSSASLGGTININGGMLTLTGNGTAQTAAFNVNAGGTLKVTGHDSFQWNGGVVADSSGNIVMQGAEGNLAKFIIADKDNGSDASMTLSKNITLKGHTSISSEGSSSFNTFGGKITATGTNNTISSAIQIRAPLPVEVGDSAELLISGVISNNSDTTRSGEFRKTGAGRLTLSAENTYTYSTTIKAGTVIAKNAKAFGTLASGKSLTVEGGAKLQISTSKVDLGTAGAGVVLESGAKLVIDYANLVATAESTDTEKTFEIMTAAVFSIYGNTLSGSDVTSSMNGAWELLGGNSAWLDSAKWTLANNTLSLTLTIPEPSVFGLLAGLGALALAGTRRRRKKA